MEENQPAKRQPAVPTGPAPAGMDILAKIKAQKEAPKVSKPEPKADKNPASDVVTSSKQLCRSRWCCSGKGSSR